jgi:hypothetical protein
VLEAFENGIEKGVLEPRALSEDMLKGFLGECGRMFYREPSSKEKMRITAGRETIVQVSNFGRDKQKIVPFRRKRACLHSGVDMTLIHAIRMKTLFQKLAGEWLCQLGSQTQTLHAWARAEILASTMQLLHRR